jgi:4-amino-4-deoxy-L-arabinose transferase-like glycosyltransferase
LWPLALGGTYAVAEALGVPRWTAGRLLQAVLGTIVVALTGAIAARLWGARVGLPAMALGAVFLPLVLDGASLISEPLFVALELGALLAVLEFRRRPGGVEWAIAAGTLAGLAALTRSSGALLAAALLIGVAARPRGLPGAAAFAAAAVLLVAPWTIRNAVVLGTFIPVSTETGGTLLGTYNPTARAAPACTGCWILMSESPMEMGLAHRLLALTEVERDRESRRLAARFALDHPGYVLQVAWENSVRLLDLAGTRRTRATAASIDVPPGAAVVGAWQLWVIIAVVVVGAGAGALRPVPRGLLVLIALLWLTTVVVQGETPRFRAALDPFLLMLAALSLAAARAR